MVTLFVAKDDLRTQDNIPLTGLQKELHSGNKNFLFMSTYEFILKQSKCPTIPKKKKNFDNRK